MFILISAEAEIAIVQHSDMNIHEQVITMFV